MPNVKIADRRATKAERSTAKVERVESQRLPDLCAECIMLIVHLRANKEYGEAMELRRRILDLLERLKRTARRADIEQADVDAAVFALVAFLDETIINSEWSQKDLWMVRLLQEELFSLNTAGNEFFSRLEQLRQRPQMYAEVLEVYYLCMALGFKGKYQLQDADRLRTLIEDTYHDLQRAGRTPNDEWIAPNGKRRDEIVEVVTREVPLWVIGAAAATLGFLFFVVLRILIGNAANAVVHTIP